MSRRPTLYTLKDAAATLGCHVNTLKYHISEGHLQPLMVGTTAVLGEPQVAWLREVLETGTGKRAALDRGAPPPPQLYGSAEAAAYLGVSLETIRWYILQGYLHGTKLGKSWAFTQHDLDSFQAGRRSPGRPKGSGGQGG